MKDKLLIITRLLKEGAITPEEGITLMQTEKEHVYINWTYSSPNVLPDWNSNVLPDWMSSKVFTYGTD